MEPIIGTMITWALQGVVALGLMRVLRQQDENTKSLADLREELPKTYTPLPVFDQHRKENREDIHGLRDEFHKHEMKCPLIKAVQ